MKEEYKKGIGFISKEKKYYPSNKEGIDIEEDARGSSVFIRKCEQTAYECLKFIEKSKNDIDTLNFQGLEDQRGNQLSVDMAFDGDKLNIQITLEKAE